MAFYNDDTMYQRGVKPASIPIRKVAAKASCAAMFCNSDTMGNAQAEVRGALTGKSVGVKAL